MPNRTRKTAVRFALLLSALSFSACDQTQKAAEPVTQGEVDKSWTRLTEVLSLIPPLDTSVDAKSFDIRHIDFAVLDDIIPGGFLNKDLPVVTFANPSTGETEQALVERLRINVFNGSALAPSFTPDALGVPPTAISTGTEYNGFSGGLGRGLILSGGEALSSAHSRTAEAFTKIGLHEKDVDGRTVWFNYEGEEVEFSGAGSRVLVRHPLGHFSGRGPARIIIAPSALISTQSWPRIEQMIAVLDRDSQSLADIPSVMAALEPLRMLLANGSRLVQLSYTGDLDDFGNVIHGFVLADLQAGEDKIVHYGWTFPSKEIAEREMRDMIERSEPENMERRMQHAKYQEITDNGATLVYWTGVNTNGDGHSWEANSAFNSFFYSDE